MSLYYFHLRDSDETVLDTEGRELDGIEEIAAAALLEARGILSVDVLRGELLLDQAIEVEDKAGRIVHHLPFIDAIRIVWPNFHNEPVAANGSSTPSPLF